MKIILLSLLSLSLQSFAQSRCPQVDMARTQREACLSSQNSLQSALSVYRSENQRLGQLSQAGEETRRNLDTCNRNLDSFDRSFDISRRDRETKSRILDRLRDENRDLRQTLSRVQKPVKEWHCAVYADKDERYNANGFGAGPTSELACAQAKKNCGVVCQKHGTHVVMSEPVY